MKITSKKFYGCECSMLSKNIEILHYDWHMLLKAHMAFHVIF